MILTNTEYMSEPARAERVVRGLADMTVAQLSRACGKKGMKYMLSELIPKEKLSEGMVQDMTYLELACLVDYMGGRPEYGGYSYDSRSEQLIYFKCVAVVLLEGRKNSIPIRMFTSLSLKAFRACICDIAASKGVETKSLRMSMMEFCNGKEDCTIGEFLSEKVAATNKGWIPIESVKEYKKKMKDAYVHMGICLITSFQRAFPEKFMVSDILDKYHDFVGDRCEESRAFCGDDEPLKI